MTEQKLSLFQAYGVELEYMIVHRETLNVLPIADQLFKSISGAFVTEIERGPISLNNELALHVVELKTTKPAPKLQPLPPLFHEEIRHLNQRLAAYNAMLMPTAMHPWMDSIQEFQLWPHEEAEIYDALHRIFDCRGHGWANLQSAHLNLPFGNEEEFVRLHAAIRLVLPLIPTIAASSPFADGRHTGCKDFRIATYRNNARKIFSVTGHVIPEPVTSIHDYHRLILEPMYADLAPHDPNGVLRYEWMNARGAIARFDRDAIEIRLTDIQEIPSQDCAIAWALSTLVRQLCEERWTSIEALNRISAPELREILDITHVQGEESPITHPGFLQAVGWTRSQPPLAKQWWDHFFNAVEVPAIHASALDFILKEGTLATRLERVAGSQPRRADLKTIYQELCRCLADDRLFRG